MHKSSTNTMRFKADMNCNNLFGLRSKLNIKMSWNRFSIFFSLLAYWCCWNSSHRNIIVFWPFFSFCSRRYCSRLCNSLLFFKCLFFNQNDVKITTMVNSRQNNQRNWVHAVMVYYIAYSFILCWHFFFRNNFYAFMYV